MKGSKPNDDGNLLLTAAERTDSIARNPLAEKTIRQFIDANEFINGKERYSFKSDSLTRIILSF